MNTRLIQLAVVPFLLLGVGVGCKPASETNKPREAPTITLERAIEMHKPQILKIGDAELLCVPNTRMQGYNWQVEYKFYVYEDGVLRSVPYGQPKASQ